MLNTLKLVGCLNNKINFFILFFSIIFRNKDIVTEVPLHGQEIIPRDHVLISQIATTVTRMINVQINQQTPRVDQQQDRHKNAVLSQLIDNRGT